MFKAVKFAVNLLAIAAVSCGLASYAITSKSELSDKPVRSGDLQPEFERKIAKVFKSLGLSADQQSKLKELRKARAAEMKSLGAAIHEKHEAVIVELKKSDYSLEKVRQLHEEGRALDGKLDDCRFSGLLEVRKVLTDEQFWKMMEMMPAPDAPGGKARRDGEKKADK